MTTLPKVAKGEHLELPVGDDVTLIIERSADGTKGRVAEFSPKHGQHYSYISADQPESGRWYGPMDYVCSWHSWSNVRRSIIECLSADGY